VRIYYEDTDAGGVVYHANYLRFFERARTDMLALLGADIGQALGAGEGGYVVSDAHLQYRLPAKLGDALIVVSRMNELRSASCIVHQRVMRDGQLIVEGRLTVAFVGADGRPRRQPAAWIEAFKAIQQGDPDRR
jgi:acyl-CoA thioester hydrolase